ncbi:very short patch repair endonuclease [Cryobacterium sp. BB736]|uniref:very short patch repair endonuclease n=1 Tax=Cryobacterium sp. BB736 TaxID=2746963 RepID=UPI001873C3D3|nr:very short patch repair endonuclease [Cryobacterium sp. BB736]
MSWASSPGRRRIMQSVKSRDTTPELAVRRLLHARGLRYRVNLRPQPNLRRTADIVFTRQRVAVFIDGCFWHGCPAHYREPRVNDSYWRTKINQNRLRDASTTAALEAEGWMVMRFWAHEMPATVADAISVVVRTD